MNLKYEEMLRLKRQDEELQVKQMFKPVLVTEVLSINRLNLSYTGLYPGEVAEEVIEVLSRADGDLTYKIHVLCEDRDLDQLDEYVFSMRKTGGYDYNDKYLIMQSPGVKSTYKIAVKVPNFREPRTVKGKLVIFSDELKGKIVLPISCKVVHA